jgi:hypothetical protein
MPYNNDEAQLFVFFNLVDQLNDALWIEDIRLPGYWGISRIEMGGGAYDICATVKGLYRHLQEVKTALHEVFVEFQERGYIREFVIVESWDDISVTPPYKNIPTNAQNAISYNAIQDGNNMVNFHEESTRGRYYKRDSYNQLMASSATNPYTRQPIRSGNAEYYRARVATRRGGRRLRGTRRGSTRHGTRRISTRR